MCLNDESLSQLIPRLIRLRDAPFYLGMDRNRFNAEVRPYLTQIPIGEQGIAFDRLEMDAWVEQYKFRNGRPGRRRGDQLWDVRRHRGSSNAPVSGTSTNASAGSEFARVLAQIDSKKPKSSSPD
jgi:hypothetical protein